MPKPTGKKRRTAIVDSVKELRRVFELQMVPDLQRWERNQNLFKGLQDWGKTRDENPWMNKVSLRLFSSVVRQIAATAQNMIFTQPDFLGIEHDEDDELARILEKVLRYEVRKMGFERKFNEAMLVGGTYGILPLKVAVAPRLVTKPEVIIAQLEKQQQREVEKIASDIETRDPNIPQDEDSVRGLLNEALVEMFGAAAPGFKSPTLGGKKLFEVGFEYSIVNPHNFFWLPDIADINDSPFFIEQSFWSQFQLEAMFKSGVLDRKHRTEVLKGGIAQTLGGEGVVHSGTDEGQRFAQRDQFDSRSQYMPRVELMEYFGPWIMDDGMIGEEDKHFIIANDVLAKDQSNPYFAQMAPYFTAVFSKVPGKAVGEGVVDGGAEHNLLMNDIFSLYMDLLKLEVLTPRVWDSSKVVDPSQLENGIEPQALIEGSGDANKIFSNIEVGAGNTGNSVLQIMEFLRLSAEQSSAVDTQSTNPSSRARISATEIDSNQGRQAQSQTTHGAIIDNEIIMPAAERVLQGILQWGFETSNLARLASRGVITDQEFQLVAQIPKVSRYNELTRNFKIQVKGFREVLERNQRAQRMTEFISVASQNPQMNDDVDYKEVLRVLAGPLGADTDKFIRQNTPQDTAREENRILSDNKIVMPAPQEQHALHLPIHYERALRDLNDAFLQHILTHIQMANQQGQQVPPPPPELAEILGINEPEEQQTNGVART